MTPTMTPTMTPITITHSTLHAPARPFTPNHVATTVTFTASHSEFTFEHQHNPRYCSPAEADFARSLLLDADAYAVNPFTFAQELGMPMDTEAEQQEALHAWQECGRAYEFVQSLTQPERDYLTALADDDDDE